MPATLIAQFSGDQVALSTSAVLLHTSSAAANSNEPEQVLVQNNTAIDITVGGSDVTDGANGVLLPASGNNSVTISLKFPGIEIWAIAASGTPSANVVRV